MDGSGSLRELPLAGELIGEEFVDWSADLRAEFDRNQFNGRIGGRLIEENRWGRVWEISLMPGERVPAHRHVLNYSWIAVTAGRSRQHTHDGTTRAVTYEVGEGRSFVFGPGEFLLHDLENIGDTALVFLTTEFFDSANRPLPL